MASRRISITVNGTVYAREVEPRLLFVHFLRDELGLTGTHIGCDTSQCGACTVLMGDDAIKSCTMFAVQADGRTFTTVEGLAADGVLHRTPWTTRNELVTARIGGAELELGSQHPMAQELRSIGLPKAAFMSMTTGRMTATFGAATTLS